jgi:L-alanine-DL-glutamate epimerase-like enolase superfamily enzyme
VKITRVDSVVLTLPMLIDGATPMLGGRAGASIDMLLVRVETDAGITGWGEALRLRLRRESARRGHPPQAARAVMR